MFHSFVDCEYLNGSVYLSHCNIQLYAINSYRYAARSCDFRAFQFHAVPWPELDCAADHTSNI